MAFMKIQFEFYLIDSFRYGNATQICQAILSACACTHDNVIHMQSGLVATIAGLTGLGERSIEIALVTLQKRSFLTKQSEFLCQINPAFMQKTSKNIKYNGNKQDGANEQEMEFLFKVYAIATESWALRGKNYIKQTKETDMIKNLQKELKEERIQAKARFEESKASFDQITAQLQAIIEKFVPEQEKEDVRTKLRIVKPD